jgi:hypothetical protein
VPSAARYFSPLARRLRDALSGDVFFDNASRGRYATDASIGPTFRPRHADTVKTAAKGGAGVSPYTPQTLDIAITHLERVLCAKGADSLFPQAYWRGRVLQAYATRGLTRTQQERLRRLLDLLESAPTDFKPQTQAAREMLYR